MQERPILKNDNEIDLTQVKASCEELLNSCNEDMDIDDLQDLRIEISDRTLEALYGADVFDWIGDTIE